MSAIGDAVGMGCTIEDFAVFGLCNHSRQRKWAAGDVFDEALHAGTISFVYAHRVVNAESESRYPAGKLTKTGYLLL